MKVIELNFVLNQTISSRTKTQLLSTRREGRLIDGDRKDGC
jgi:hypothetical protein